MDFFCLPIICGFQTKVKPDGAEQQARICPRCNNAAVFAAKRSHWFELFCIPVFPFRSKHVWMCNICQFMADHKDGQWEPAVAGYRPPPPGQGFQPPQHAHGGYQPTYLNQHK